MGGIRPFRLLSGGTSLNMLIPTKDRTGIARRAICQTQIVHVGNTDVQYCKLVIDVPVVHNDCIY